MSNYVYMFLNEFEEPLYIGISKKLATRIETQNFKGKSGNLSKECIEETHKILYHQATSADDMKIKERYLINTLNPKYNNKMDNGNNSNFSISFDWLEYEFNKDELLRDLKEIKRSYQSSAIILRNHRKQIVPIPYGWVPYGICIEVDINTFFKIKEKGKKDTLFIVIQGEFYICDDKELVGYWLNYKEIIRNRNLDRKKDFINVITKQEINRYENDIRACKDETLEEIKKAGKCFIRYEIVKKLEVYNDKKFLQFEEIIKKVKAI